MTSYTYRVQATIAGAATTLAYDVRSTDAPDYGLVDPVTVGWTYPTSAELTPTQIEPPLAEFGVVLPDIADLGDVNIGSTVDLYLYAGPAENLVAEFHGRVSDMRAAPYFRQVGAVVIKGVLVGFSAVDYLADLGEDDDYAEAGLAAGDLRDRIVGVLSPRAGESNTPATAPDVPTVLADIDVVALSATSESSLTLLARWLDEWPLVLSGGSWGVLDPWLDPDQYCLAVATYDGDQAVVHPIRKDHANHRHQGILNADGTVSWSADVPDGVGRAWLADACTDVLRDVVYTRTKRGYPNRWVSKAATGSASVTTGERPYVSVVREVDFQSSGICALHAMAMRPPMVDSTGWEASAFTLLLHDDSELVDPGSPLMVRHADIEETLTGVLVITGIPATQSPVTHGGDVYAGRLTSAKFRVNAGQVTVDVTLRPEYPRPRGGLIFGSDNGLTLDGVQDFLPALQVDQVDPSVTVNLCRLIRQAT